jgi:hypothetical protein
VTITARGVPAAAIDDEHRSPNAVAGHTRSSSKVEPEVFVQRDMIAG